MSAKGLFNSQKFGERKKTLSEILNYKNFWQGRLPPVFVEYFSLVINAHHRSHGDTLFHNVRIVSNEMYKHFNFCCDMTRGGERTEDIVGIGSTLAADPQRDLLEVATKRARQYMRFCITKDMAQLRSILVENNPCCELCGCEVTNETSHLDHSGDKEFRHIAVDFLKIVDPLTIDFIHVAGNPLHFNEELTQQWKTYHNENAKLQLLCIPCNLKKDKK